MQGNGNHEPTPAGQIDFVDHPTQLFLPNTSYWQDAWTATLASAPQNMAALAKHRLAADPNPNTNVTHPHSGVLMLDYEPAYRPGWRFHTSSRPDKLWAAFLQRVHTPALDHNWTRLVGWTPPAGHEGGWESLSASQQDDLMGASWDFFCKAYLSAGFDAIRAAIPPAVKLSVCVP